jgi:hypothetical protein
MRGLNPRSVVLTAGFVRISVYLLIFMTPDKADGPRITSVRRRSDEPAAARGSKELAAGDRLRAGQA